MLVRNYNIGRRDCILVSKKKDNLLIDCGVTQHSAVIKDINSDLRNKNNVLLLTHFHRDHIDGLEYIDGNSFDHVIISRFGLCIFSERNVNYLVKLLKLMAYSTPRSDTRTMIQNIFSIFKLISMVIKGQGKVCFANRGDDIRHVDDFEVIHPDIKCNDFLDIIHSESLDSFIRETESYMNPNELEELNGAIRDFIGQHRDITGTLFKNDENIKVNFIELEQIGNDLLSYHKMKLDKIIELADEYINIWVNNFKLFKDFSNEMNKNSVVIQNKKVLFMGDVTRKVVGDLKNLNYFQGRNYKLIKTPHHGAKDYFTKKLPFAKYYISCSNSHKDINTNNPYLLNNQKVKHIFSDGSLFYKGKVKLNKYRSNKRYYI